ncbi:hypothetical protein ElyMa_000436700 [Elysia marginata]|uniref:Uncharacterized protein n=1 Tax=Elysia marginata TaxID=1093978 RepID=A0AAV4FPR3_9GAST|nr:hypothetical protein ElyMa_000436700 [Elysia marginata]
MLMLKTSGSGVVQRGSQARIESSMYSMTRALSLGAVIIHRQHALSLSTHLPIFFSGFRKKENVETLELLKAQECAWVICKSQTGDRGPFANIGK